MQNKGMLLVLSGPSGSGKDTVIAELFKSDLPIIQSISMTTRPMRSGEKDGADYFFTDKENFENAIKDNQMLEYAQYGGNYYGTPKAPIDKWLDEGKVVILKIDVQGCENIKKSYADAASVFIIPPSMSVLEKRLRGRGSETEESIVRRLKIAENELQKVTMYDYAVINDELEKAVDDIKVIINAELMKVSRVKNILSEVCK